VATMSDVIELKKQQVETRAIKINAKHEEMR
jgi:hypothetical protein